MLQVTYGLKAGGKGVKKCRAWKEGKGYYYGGRRDGKW